MCRCLVSLIVGVSKMAKRGAYAVLVGCHFINGLFTLDQPSYLFNTAFPVLKAIVLNVGIGFALLFFPLIGLVANVCFTRYRCGKVVSK